MATIGGTALTLVDIAKQMDPDGKVASIVEILSQSNQLFEDMTFIEANDGDAHQTTIRTGLPQGTWRRYNEGVQPNKGTTAQVRVNTGMLEANSVVDVDLAEKGGNAKQVRANEAVAHIMGMAQQAESAILYEDERTNPTRITGLLAHYASVNPATAQSAENVVDAGGTGSDNASALLVCWGPNTITGIFPKGSRAGLHHEDKGVVQVADATGVAGAVFDAYRDKFAMKVGVAVRDWRYAVRVANVDVSNLVAESSAADLVKKMIIAEEKLPTMGMGRCAWYMNRKLRTMLRIQYLAKASAQITFENVLGKPVMMSGGIPIRIADSLLNTEARIV